MHAYLFHRLGQFLFKMFGVFKMLVRLTSIPNLCKLVGLRGVLSLVDIFDDGGANLDIGIYVLP